MSRRHNEVKYGALLSYILIAANAIYGLLIAPFILGQIGESEYGVYKTIASMTASVSVLEFGLGATLQRYTAKFRVEGNQKGACNFSAMGLLQAAVFAFAVVVTACVVAAALFVLRTRRDIPPFPINISLALRYVPPKLTVEPI